MTTPLAENTRVHPIDDGVRDNGASADTKVAPREHNTIVRASLFILAVLATMTAVAFLGWLLEPLVFAVLLFFLLGPAVDWLGRLYVPRWAAYTLLLLLIFAAVCAVGAVLVANVGSLRERMGEYQAQAKEIAGRFSPQLAAVVEQAGKQAENDYPKQAILTLYGFTEFGLMMFFYLLFIIFNSRYLPGRVRRAFPDEADRILGVAHKISDQMQRYVGIKTLVGIGLGVTVAVVLALFGLPYWPLWGFLFFLLNYITYLGSIAACVPPIALAFLQFDPVTAALLTACLIAVRLLWIDVVEIKLSGQELNIDSVLLLFGLAFWGYFWGVAGLVLAVPIITAVKLILQSIEHTRPWAILISET